MASITRRTTQTGDTKYDVRYRDPTGRQRKRTFSRRRDADRFARTVEVEMETGRYIDPAAGTVGFTEYSERWLRHSPDLRPRTRENYEYNLSAHLSPHFGNTPINRIRSEEVREWWAHLHEKDLAQATRAKIYRLLHAIFETALDDELIVRNPCRIKGAGTEKSPERPTASVEEVWP